jgi:LPXTG-motif cell wall-anchored protein
VQGPGSGTPTTLLAGLGLVGLVGAGAAYLALRRRATT